MVGVAVTVAVEVTVGIHVAIGFGVGVYGTAVGDEGSGVAFGVAAVGSIPQALKTSAIKSDVLTLTSCNHIPASSLRP